MMTGQSGSSASQAFGLLTKSQRYWYAELLIAAILADGEISLPEANYIKEIIHFIKTPEEKNRLLERIASKSSPPISKPSGVLPKVLAAIYTELCLVLIADVELTADETDFLKNVSEEFNFTEAYFKKLMAWCDQGLKWKSLQLELITDLTRNEDLKVPVDQLSDDQLVWYATTLVSTIMSDEKLDASEVGFLKMAIGLVKDPIKQRELAKMVKTGTIPEMVSPPNMDNEVLVRVFFEVMLIISADESLEEHELSYLKQLADLCGFSVSQYQNMIDWCQRGIQWKQNKNPLIAQVELNKREDNLNVKVFRANESFSEARSFEDEEEPTGTPGELSLSAPEKNIPDRSDAPETEPNTETNAVVDFNMGCFVCGSIGVVKHFQLKPKSIKSGHNIFGIPIYQVSTDGVEYIDYNRCKVTVCPNCFFASTQRQMFKQKPDSLVPPLIAKEGFIDSWLSKKADRQLRYAKFMDEFDTVNRSHEFTVESYKSAIETSEEMAKANESMELQWHAVTLKLTLSEVLISAGYENEAMVWLKHIHKTAVDIFKSTKKRFIKFRSGRLILLLAVYFGKQKAVDKYFDYFTQLNARQIDRLSSSDQALFKKVYGEMKRAFENQAEYHKANLNGFMRVESAPFK